MRRASEKRRHPRFVGTRIWARLKVEGEIAEAVIENVSLGGALVRLSRECEPGKNVILQAVGLSPDVRVAIGRVELRQGDRFLLCSDGVTNAVTDEELREIMTGSKPRAACETMIALANDRGGDDNETVIVADLAGEALAHPDEFESVTSTYEVLQAFDAMKRR